MNPLIYRVFGSLVGIATVLSLSAAESPVGITPDALVIEALEHTAELGFYQAQLEGAKAATRLAGRLDLPKAEFQVGQVRSKNLDQSMAGEGAMWSASVRQSFEWPGRLGLRKAIANQNVALATLGLEAFRRDLSGKVRENAFGLASAEEKSRVASLVADRFRALREVLVHRDPAGIAPQLEVRIDADRGGGENVPADGPDGDAGPERCAGLGHDGDAGDGVNFFGGSVSETENALMRWLQRVYSRVLAVGIAGRGWVVQHYCGDRIHRPEWRGCAQWHGDGQLL